MSVKKELSLVLDIGSNSIRFGYAGDEAPRLKTPSFYARHIKPLNAQTSMTAESDHIMREEYLYGNSLNSDNPFYEYMSLVDSDDKETPVDKFLEVYSADLCSRLSLDPRNYPVLIAEPNRNSKEFREKIGTLFERAGVPKMFLCKKAALSLYSCGKSSGVIFESGAGSTSATPVEEGYVHQEAISVTPFGGDVITDEIAADINPQHLKSQNVTLGNQIGDYHESYLSFMAKLEANRVKKSLFSFELDDSK